MPFLCSLEPGWQGPLDGLAGGAAPYALSRLFPAGSVTVAVTDHAAVDRWTRALRFFAPGRRVLAYPADNGRPWDGNVRDPELAAARIVARASSGAVVVAEARALLARVPPLDARTIRAGDRLDPQALVRWLVARGYLASPQVDGPGTVALRGGGVEAWGIGDNRSTRVLFLDDEVEAVRGPATLLPAREAALDSARAERAAAYVHAVANERGVVGRDRRQVLADLREGTWFASCEDYLPALAECGPPELPFPVLVHEPALVEAALARAWDDVERRLDALHEEDKPLVRLGDRYAPVKIDGLALRAGGLGFDTRSNADLRVGSQGDLAPVVTALRKRAATGASVVLVADDATRANRIRQLLEPHGLVPGDAPAPRTVALVVGDLPEGFTAPDIAFVTADEIFGERLRTETVSVATRFRRAAAGGLGTVNRGEPVVHARHGIGLYRGLARMPLGETAGDFVVVEYRDGDRLYVPVFRLDLLAPYRSPGDAPAPRLDKLGGSTWELRRAKVRDAVIKLAAEILRIHAGRKLAQAPAFTGRDALFARFEEAFPYVETPEQQEAIEAVLGDLAAGTPMDRLVVGDVGFGKTEVAMRAAFRVLLEGYQALVLVPTTVLAAQHLRSFKARLEPFGARVEGLSRLVDSSRIRTIVSDVSSGKVDVLVATTAALGRSVRFRRLGLVVVDEEHRFGTKQKEDSRRLASGIHYLALSATPIPRTLHMALGGLRSLSLITTPPEGRVPIHTEVVRFDATRIREEILAEKARGGQAFLVHNRVQSIAGVGRWLAKIVPEASVEVAHGQMSAEKLESAMARFAGGEVDVLLCTAIVESGVDLPNANLMLINRAESFGVAQLYQLRGRVGRADVGARCILLVGGTGVASKQALGRLHALMDANALGSGFGLASRDLELRGGGEILGEKQHGHIAAIGFDAYVQLLDEAVHRLRGDAAQPPVDTEVEVPLPAFLPEDWVPDAADRLDAYQKLSLAPNANRVAGVFADLERRHGPPPLEAQNLRRVTELRITCRDLGVTKCSMLRVRAVVVLSPRHALDPQRLVDLCTREPARFRAQGSDAIEVRCTPEEAREPFTFLDWAIARLQG
ncbi:MAG: DEAD/DEAH box helicase [Deltaproteobacteria bacterium]|nr:DEAD/DEAH box helicase [Deltaproteobacteria bacterium]